MKSKNYEASTYKLIASHAAVVSLFTNVYFISVLSDLFRFLTNDSSESVLNQSMVSTLSFISLVTLVVAVLAILVLLLKKK
jgi:hypothetical protein